MLVSGIYDLVSTFSPPLCLVHLTCRGRSVPTPCSPDDVPRVTPPSEVYGVPDTVPTRHSGTDSLALVVGPKGTDTVVLRDIGVTVFIVCRSGTVGDSCASCLASSYFLLAVLRLSEIWVRSVSCPNFHGPGI